MDEYEEKQPNPDAGDILAEAKERFQQAHEAFRDDFTYCKDVQAFIAGRQWPEKIQNEREGQDRPCLTLDKLNQNVRHIVNGGMLRERDVRVLAMSGDADDEVAEVQAGMIRQITQTSSSKIAYETGLRHAVSNGFGYWRVAVQLIPGTQLKEIAVKKIKEPRMVLLDAFCDYPDGRDSKYGFVFSKLTRKEFNKQYKHVSGYEECKSWADGVLETTVLPWTTEGSIILAEYFYYDGDTLKWAICTPDKILDEGPHHGNLIPIIRVLGDEYEDEGKHRVRGIINASSMDAQRAYNYSASAFIENVALAPLAPWVAADGQVDQYKTEWLNAHRVPRGVLRYKAVSHQGHLVPPPQRAMPAGIPEGWQGMMNNLVGDLQMIMGMAQPNVLGTGGIPVQSGVGVQAQQDPGDVNVFHFIDHWHGGIEQTGRVILSMIPYVYTKEQAVKIVGADGVLETAILNPNLPEPVRKNIQKTEMGLEKTLSKEYNHSIGRYDVAISTGPSSANKKAEANRMMVEMVRADPSIMQKAPDLVVKSMDMAGSDELSKRLRAFLPPGIAEDDEALIRQQLQQFGQENQQLKQQMAEMEKIILGEREKAQADLMQADMKRQGEVALAQQSGEIKLIQQQLQDEGKLKLAAIDGDITIQKTTLEGMIKVVLEKMKSQSKIDVEVMKQLANIGQMESYEERMGGYAGVLDSMNASTPETPIEPPSPPAPKEPDRQPIIFQVGDQQSKKKSRKAIRITRPDGSQSMAEVLDLDDEPEGTPS